MGSFNVKFERTTLNMVVHAVGRGEIAHLGEAGTSVYWLCYTVPRARHIERVWIAADGEMGGEEHAITQITAQEVPSTAGIEDCPYLPEAVRPLSFSQGVWLGTQENQALNILGRPSHQENRWWVFDFQGSAPGGCGPNGFSVSNWFTFETEGGRLIRIHAGQVTSC